MNTSRASTLIERLGLSPHPEGGWYRETWRAAARPGERAAGTAILFLLEAHQRSHWHRIDADELWMWHAGDPLRLSLSISDAGPVENAILGPDIAAGHEVQRLIAAGRWQAADPDPGGRAGYTLISCVVVPAFEFAGFTLASPGWAPGS